MSKRCPFFSSRVDFKGLHAVVCIDRVHGISKSREFRIPAVRDLYYVTYCERAPQECPLRNAIRRELVVHHPGHDAMYDIYGKLLTREPGSGEVAERT